MAESPTSTLPCIVNVHDFLQQNEAGGYDYIIIGGGTAGLVLANRLSEDPAVAVGVLEFGGAHINDPTILTPALSSKLLGDPEYDWNYETVPQVIGGKTHIINRGKGLGGSSAVNWLLYSRGQKQDFDQWEELGNEGWNWETLWPYFLKYEAADPTTGDNSQNLFDAKLHGTGGPIHTSVPASPLPYEAAFYESVLKAGLKLRESGRDSQGGDSFASHLVRNSIDTQVNRGTRSYSVTGYLQPASNRDNLKVLCSALVSRVVLSQQNGVVTTQGVEFEAGGQKYVVKTRREVIVCAGTLETPKLLELSGIGDPDVLSAAGIDALVVNKSVGENLQDHVATGVVYELEEDELSLDVLNFDPEQGAAAMKQYTESRTGPMAGGFNFVYPLSFAQQSMPEDLAKMMNAITSYEVLPQHGHVAQINILKRRISEYWSVDGVYIPLPFFMDFKYCHCFKQAFAPAELNKKCHISLTNQLRRPFSRGSIHIVDSDPHTRPKIDPKFLSHPADVLILSQGLQNLDRALNLEPVSGKLKKRVIPPQDIDMQIEENRIEFIKNSYGNEFHCAGSCALGLVLDNRLRVKGVHGLRVCDASVFPTVPTCNPTSTVYVVAERGADIIKEDWKAGYWWEGLVSAKVDVDAPNYPVAI